MSCEDIPSLLDLQKVKKHADDFGRLMGTGEGDSTNEVTGQTRPTYNKVMKGLGYTRVGTFATGGTLTTGRQTLLWDIADGGDGQEYGWSGAFPKVVPAASTPASTGGISVGAWMSRFDPELRTDLMLPSGASNIGFEQAGTGAVPRTAQDKMRERITPMDFGAVGDGVVNDDAAFAALEASFSGRVVDLQGKTYAVTTRPSGNTYVNGDFTDASGTWNASHVDTIRAWDTPVLPSGPGPGVIAIGTNAAKNILDNPTEPDSRAAIAMGREALGNTHRGIMCIAIGDNVLSKGQPGAANIGIGAFSLTHVQGGSDSVSALPGSRNIGIGTLAGHFIDSGSRNNLVGRDAGHALTSGQHNNAMGYGAFSTGWCSIGLSGQIENQAPNTSTNGVAIGSFAGAKNNGSFNVYLGQGAGAAWKSSAGNTVIGSEAAQLVDSDVSLNNKKLRVPAVTAATYSQAGNIITITSAGHGVTAGLYGFFQFTSGMIFDSYTDETVWYPITTVIDADHFTITSPVSLTTSGNVTFSQVETTTVLNSGTANTIIGRQALLNSTGVGNRNTVVGFSALASATRAVEYSAVLGNNALSNLTTGINNTAVGRNSGNLAIDGTNLTSVTNSTMLGQGTRVSGSNQVQLGDAATTTYVYGTVQNRSDIRDKTDIQDTKLGIDFIMGLRPVDGRWDMRDDYVTVDDDGNATRLPKDGSKKRERLHHWFIAQEVKALCDSLGVEFGGYQDHSVNGGGDVLSLGYDEFIPPTVKAVQQCWQRMDELEARLAKLEGAV